MCDFFAFIFIFLFVKKLTQRKKKFSCFLIHVAVCAHKFGRRKNKYFNQFSFCANRTKHLWQPKVKLYENGNIEKADIPSPLWLSQETFSMTAAAGGITRVKIRFNLTSNRNKLPITKFDSVPFLFLLY